METDAQKHSPADGKRLIAAARNAFDRAGRELGIDATELAEGLDVAALIWAAEEAADMLDRDELGTLPPLRVAALVRSLRKALSPVSTLNEERKS